MDLVISAIIGRTGSTMIQRIFNSRKETLIWGEHGGIVTTFTSNLYDTLKHFSTATLSERNGYFNHNENPNTWIASMTPEMKFVDKALVCGLRSLLDSLYSSHRTGHDIVGFKEIRYGTELELLRKCYPDMKVVLWVRNPLDIWGSVGHRNWYTIDALCNTFNERGELYIKYNKKFSNFHLIRYEDVINKDPKTLSLICQLGKLELGDIYKVLDVKLLSTNREILPTDAQIIKSKCEDVMKKLNYL